MSISNDPTLQLLEKGLDALSARQQAISNNIANVETPNYKAVDVAFERSLRRAMNESGAALSVQRTDDGHLRMEGRAEGMEDVEAQMFRRTGTSMRLDGNNVDIETEMVRLAETAMRYQSFTTLASRKLALLRMIAQESR
ncbi:MAG: flagellar basal body rod protein FlgB [Caldilineaceae bacterium]|nr:flagellar basal body rod protein FlgB [Caldilineaceae bacterium]HRJ42407.1 flagellar basal body rod protein FlgB [Caldilineaceae bacterium]